MFWGYKNYRSNKIQDKEVFFVCVNLICNLRLILWVMRISTISSKQYNKVNYIFLNVTCDCRCQSHIVTSADWRNVCYRHSPDTVTS